MKLKEKDISNITKEIREKVFKPINQFKITIFLCGASINDKSTLRYKTSKVIKGYTWFHWYEIVYPEILFEKILHRNDILDVQNLETMLAESVDVIVICPESPGSFTELGAFTHDERLKDKIVCIQNEKYKRAKSYINTGPVKILNKSQTSQVVYVSDRITDKQAMKIRSAINKIEKSVETKKDVINLLELENFVIPCIYLFDPISKELLVKIVSKAMKSEKFGKSGTEACLNILLSQNQIIQSQDGISLSESGLKKFHEFMKSKSKYSKGLHYADKLRLEIMNLKYRNKSLVWA
jgi:hypothetical protein